MANPPDSEELRRQLQAHLRRLAAAGIEWLPQGPPLQIAPPPQHAKPSAVTVVQPSLPGVEEPANEAVAELSVEQRRIALAQLADEVSGCTRCPELCSTRTQTVFGDGRPGVELCFIGEAPGEDEDR